MLRKTISYTLLGLLTAFMLLPLLWMLLVSFHESKAPIPDLARLWPSPAHTENYGKVLFEPELPVFRFFLNSALVAVLTVAGQLLFCSMAAYAFARLRFPGRNGLFSLFLVSMMFTGVVTQIPVFMTVRAFGWLDTYLALIVPALSSSFNVFLLRQFFVQIPAELDESCKLDGASDWVVYSRIVMPLAKPALATCAAFSFFASWTDFFWPLLATSSMRMRTLEVGLSFFRDSYAGANWPLQMTAAVIVLTPIVAVFLLSQKFFVKGLTVGSIK